MCLRSRVSVVRILAHLVRSHGPSRSERSTTWHQPMNMALSCAKNLLIDCCQTHCACDGTCPLGGTPPINAFRRRSASKPVRNCPFWRDYLSNRRATWIIRQIKLIFVIKLVKINYEPPQFQTLTSSGTALPAVLFFYTSRRKEKWHDYLLNLPGCLSSHTAKTQSRSSTS